MIQGSNKRVLGTLTTNHMSAIYTSTAATGPHPSPPSSLSSKQDIAIDLPIDQCGPISLILLAFYMWRFILANLQRGRSSDLQIRVPSQLTRMDANAGNAWPDWSCCTPLSSHPCVCGMRMSHFKSNRCQGFAHTCLAIFRLDRYFERTVLKLTGRFLVNHCSVDFWDAADATTSSALRTTNEWIFQRDTFSRLFCSEG